MKTLLLLFIVSNSIFLSSKSHNQLTLTKKETKSLYDNDLARFVDLVGSEETAISKLIQFSLPDTFYNRDDRRMIWYTKTPANLIKEDYYASRKIQSFYWISKIYHSDYEKKKDKIEFCRFINAQKETISDYQDLDVTKKAYYHQVIIPSPIDSKDYFNNLGYKRLNNESYQKLENSFNSWYEQMKTNGLLYMRENKIEPIDSSSYEVKYSTPLPNSRLKRRMLLKKKLREGTC